MKGGIQRKLAKSLSGNVDLNKKALTMKKSWDEVSGLLKATPSKKK